MKYLVWDGKEYHIIPEVDAVLALLESAETTYQYAIWRLREKAEPLRLYVHGGWNALYLADKYGNMEV